MTTKIVDSAHLYFQEGNSDKVYDVNLETDGFSWSVSFSYGRRGGNMTEGYKVKEVPEDVARKEFVKLVNSKTKKGYRHS